MKSKLRTNATVKFVTQSGVHMDMTFPKESCLKYVLKQLSPWVEQSKILLSRENISGHKLEELAATLQAEIAEKSSLIESDNRPQAKQVHRNNTAIIEHLKQIEALQRSSLEELKTIGPDEGPLGTLRIGKTESGNKS